MKEITDKEIKEAVAQLKAASPKTSDWVGWMYCNECGKVHLFHKETSSKCWESVLKTKHE